MDRAVGLQSDANTPDATHARRQEITAKFFHGLSDLTRLAIVELLLDEGEQNVSQLVARLGQPQSRVSNHLACLRWCGYVDSRREGKFVYYRVADPRVRQLLALAREVIGDHAEAILSCTRIPDSPRLGQGPAGADLS
jgi:ArsR family transcriptional regulator, cadmium/lead-responsive transcriptional repressor